MAKKYNREQLWKLYEKLPEDLKEAIFSGDTAENLYEACARNGIEDDRIPEIARYVGRVLLGILPLDKFQKTLEEEVKLKKETAKRISREVNRFIFYPLKSSLEEISKTPGEPTPSVSRAVPTVEEEQKVPPKEDIYREKVE